MIPTPFRYRDLVGPPERYCIHEGYTPRLDNLVYDDRSMTDEFQREVYEYARAVYERDGLKGVCDFGCGSGYKLVNYFRDACTLGLELPPMVDFLREKYPGFDWRTVNLYADRVSGACYQLCIIADVIEHLHDPDLLLRFIKRCSFRRIVLSTPERDELQHGTWDGPPKNLHHVREWNFAELHAYLDKSFTIREHFVLNATQIIEFE